MHPNGLAARSLSLKSPQEDPPMGAKATYQNQEITVVRPAKQGDKDFKPAGGEQVVVRLKDGSEKTVPKAEVTEAE